MAVIRLGELLRRRTGRRAGGVEDEEIERDKDTGGHETGGTDLGENLLQPIGGVVHRGRRPMQGWHRS